MKELPGLGISCLCFWFFASVASASEMKDAVERLQSRTSLDSQDQEFWRKTHETWLESEKSGGQPGDPEVGKALENLSQGRLPDNDGAAAIVRLYNRSKSEEYAQRQEALDSPHQPPARGNIRPQPAEGENPMPYVGLLLGFLIAVVGVGIMARIVKRSR